MKSRLRNTIDHLKTPQAYDVLACIQKYPVGTFSQFCSDFGYEEDSRKAEACWKACADEYARVSAFFSEEELEKLQEVN